MQRNSAETLSEAKSARTTSPASLLSQWWTMGAITSDRRTTGRHAKVAWVIIDRYMKAHGNGRASVRYIGTACGLSKSIVMKACRELVEWGYFSQRIGVGTRPTEFTPKWSCVPPVSDTTDNEASVPQGYNATVLHDSNASEFSVSPVVNESYLPEPADKAGLQVGRNDQFEAAPLAPLPDGQKATVADTASGGFGEFWSIWPRKHGKVKATTTYAKLNASPELHAHIIAAATEWAAHYAKHGTEKKWMPEPANWLANERYDEDLPIIHGDAKGASIAKAKANALPKPANDNATEADDSDAEVNHVEDEPYEMVNDVGPFSPFGAFTGSITNVSRSGENNETWTLTLDLNNAEHLFETQHSFRVEHIHPDIAARGRAFVQSIIDAIGISVEEATETDELLYRDMLVTIDRRLAITYEPLPTQHTKVI
jgi:hypothetical protein